METFEDQYTPDDRQMIDNVELQGPVTVFSRDELVSIRDRAEKLATIEALNPRWKRTVQALADAADQLDAMIARASVTG